MAVAQESAEVDHLKTVNQMLMAPSFHRITVDVSATVATLGTGGGAYVFIGDEFNHSTDETEANRMVVTAINASGIAADDITYTITGGSPNADEIMFVHTRGGIWSLHDVIQQDAQTINGVLLTNGPLYGSLAYGGRTAANWNAAGFRSRTLGEARIDRHRHRRPRGACAGIPCGA